MVIGSKPRIQTGDAPAGDLRRLNESQRLEQKPVFPLSAHTSISWNKSGGMKRWERSADGNSSERTEPRRRGGRISGTLPAGLPSDVSAARSVFGTPALRSSGPGSDRRRTSVALTEGRRFSVGDVGQQRLIRRTERTRENTETSSWWKSSFFNSRQV